MEGSGAFLFTVLGVCALLLVHAWGIKVGRALLKPQIAERDRLIAEKDRINGEMRAEMDKIVKDLEGPDAQVEAPVQIGDRFRWCSSHMICTGHLVHTVAGPVKCVRAEYSDRDGVVRTHMFSGTELEALRQEIERGRRAESRSIFGDFPFPVHQEDQST